MDAWPEIYEYFVLKKRRVLPPVCTARSTVYDLYWNSVMTKFDRRWASVVVALYTAMVTGTSYGYVYDVYVSLRVAHL